MGYLFSSLLILFLSCTDTPGIIIPPTEEQAINYLALGDSYTIGQSVEENESYPVQLGDSLSNSGYTIEEVRIIAKTGWTTDELQTAIDDTEDLAESYDLVSLLIGVNNQFRGRTTNTYTPEFEALLQQAINFAGGNKDRVFVLSIPDYAYTPFGNGSTQISEGIDQYNVVNKNIAEGLGVAYFDITSISREGLDDTALVASDGLHPSGKQYTEWVKLILPEVKNLLEN